MDAEAWLTSELAAFCCASCGQPYGEAHIRLIAQRDELYFVDLSCPRCGSQAVAIVTIQVDDDTTAFEAGEHVPAHGSDDEATDRPPAVSVDDVIDAHALLRDFEGDLHQLVERFGEAGAVSFAPRFAHASEAELARILDYYKVEWLYEPHVFPIRWNTDGLVVESFTPDFYLPELETYVELTTLKQSLVRKKNRKLRYLRELYPMVRIKLFYARDFRALLLKYGRLDAAASLIGSDGQAPSKRATEDAGRASERVPTVPGAVRTGSDQAAR